MNCCHDNQDMILWGTTQAEMLWWCVVWTCQPWSINREKYTYTVQWLHLKLVFIENLYLLSARYLAKFPSNRIWLLFNLDVTAIAYWNPRLKTFIYGTKVWVDGFESRGHNKYPKTSSDTFSIFLCHRYHFSIIQISLFAFADVAPHKVFLCLPLHGNCDDIFIQLYGVSIF